VILGRVANESQAIYDGYTGGLQADYRRITGGLEEIMEILAGNPSGGPVIKGLPSSPFKQ